MIFKKFSEKQIKSMFWWQIPSTKNYDAIICDGSIRSGKTMSMAIGFVLWSCTKFNGQTFAFCGKTISSLKRNVISPMVSWLMGIAEIKQNLSQNYCDITIGKNTNRYYFFGGKDESSAALIQGMTLAGIMLDEVALMPKSFVEQALARCSVNGSKMWFNCNPESPEHWFFKEWIQKKSEKNVFYLHFEMDDNLSLSESIKNRYKSLYSGIFYERFILGKWVIADGLVYGGIFDYNRHILKNYTPSKNAKFFISVDYGTLNPFSAGLWAIENGRAVRIKEYYFDSRKKGFQKTDEEYYWEIEQLADGYKLQYILIDPSAASFIATIKGHKKFRTKKARNDVLNGIRCTMAMLKKDKIFFCENCTDSIREFGLYSWDEKAGTDRVRKENDHAMDEIRYFCYTTLRRELDDYVEFFKVVKH